ncbi:MAG: hypothetical protein WBB67_00830 [bacterium]
MRQIVQNFKTGVLSVEDVPVPKVQANGLLVKNAFSLISAGTERTSVELARKSLLGKAKSQSISVSHESEKGGLWKKCA